MAGAERIVIVGGPRCGKSWLAADLSLGTTEGSGPLGTSSIYCGDPLSTVKDPCMFVNYLPEGISYSGDTGAAQWIVDNWLPMRGPWVLEGHVMARALRRWLDKVSAEVGLGPHESDRFPNGFPCDRIIVFANQRHDCDLKRGQVAMHKGVLKVWDEIEEYFAPITEWR